MKFIRIFLLVLIIIGGVLLFTQNIWVPKVVERILSFENRNVVPQSDKGTEQDIKEHVITQSSQNQKKFTKEKNYKIDSIVYEPVLIDDFAGWNEYRDKNNMTVFSYPPSWEVKVNGDVIKILSPSDIKILNSSGYTDKPVGIAMRIYEINRPPYGMPDWVKSHYGVSEVTLQEIQKQPTGMLVDFVKFILSPVNGGNSVYVVHEGGVGDGSFSVYKGDYSGKLTYMISVPSEESINDSNFKKILASVGSPNKIATSSDSFIYGRMIFHGYRKNYSLDGKLIAVTGDTEDGEIATWITDSQDKPLTTSYWGYFVSWSPDSKKILIHDPGLASVNVMGDREYHLDLSSLNK